MSDPTKKRTFNVFECATGWFAQETTPNQRGVKISSLWNDERWLFKDKNELIKRLEFACQNNIQNNKEYIPSMHYIQKKKITDILEYSNGVLSERRK